MSRGQVPEQKANGFNHSSGSGLTDPALSNPGYRITFGKGRELRFTSHLDLHHAWERTFRRAQLSLAYSEGFNPRPKINIGAALPLGCTSEADLVDVELTEQVELIEALNRAAPPGLTISRVEAVASGTPKLQKQITGSEYRIPIPDQMTDDLEHRIETVLSTSELRRVRRNKEYDLRPLIHELSLSETSMLLLKMAARSGATGRPDEVLRALGIDPTPLVPHRVRLILS